MVHTSIQSLPLEEFLKLPDTQPAREYLDGEIRLKPMPKTRHSRLQAKLTATINEVTEELKIAYAFPELRCTFGGRSIVPDIAILRWNQIECDDGGEPIDDITIAPDWTIEILSPEQSANRVSGKILHCLTHGTKLGWLVEIDDRSILTFQPHCQPQLFRGDDRPIVPDGMDLELSSDRVFGWLRMNQ